jgi:hypothetical protein
MKVTSPPVVTPVADADAVIEAMKAIPADIRHKIMYNNPRKFYPRVETL